jgi:hypothetical protein
VTVEVCDFGAGCARLLAEYDAERDAVRVNRGAVEHVRRLRGEAEAARFVRCALAHELFHRAHPQASEADARAHACGASGGDPAFYEALLRA